MKTRLEKFDRAFRQYLYTLERDHKKITGQDPTLTGTYVRTHVGPYVRNTLPDDTGPTPPTHNKQGRGLPHDKK